MNEKAQIIRAAWVAPIDQPRIRDGAVVVARGRIIDVGTARDVVARHPQAAEVDLGRSVLLPGLINAHVHLELSGCEAGEHPGGSFTDWILSLRQRVRQGEQPIEEVIASAVTCGIEQCVQFGVTTVGDIANNVEVVRCALRASPLRAVSFGEVLGLAKARPRARESLRRALDRTYESPRLRIGLSPHAPYTVDAQMYATCVDVARREGMPLATHLAETPDERAFLVHQSGPFREVWEMLEQWDEPVATYREGGSIEFARVVGLLDAGALLAHVNYCDDDELSLLARGNASVVWCPRTHRYFGHPPHRWREMLARGINVAVGTDSCASSPDLNILDDLRLVRGVAPDVPAQHVLELATVRAARALGLESAVGSLSPGKAADLVAFEAAAADPLEAILQEPLLPTHLWVDSQLMPPRRAAARPASPA